MFRSLAAIVLLLGAASGQTCNVNLSTLGSGILQCYAATYQAVATDTQLAAAAAVMAAEYDLPSSAAAMLSQVLTVGIMDPRIAVVGAAVEGGLARAFSGANLTEAAVLQLWLKARMAFDVHCTYVAPAISACVKGIVRYPNCPHIATAADNMLTQYCNLTSRRFKEEAATDLISQLGYLTGAVQSVAAQIAPNQDVANRIMKDVKNAVYLVSSLINGNATEADLVSVLVSSAQNGTLSYIDLSFMPAAVKSSTDAIKDAVAGLWSMLNLPASDLFLSVANQVVDGLLGRFANVTSVVDVIKTAIEVTYQANWLISQSANLTAFEVVPLIGRTMFGIGSTPVTNISALVSMNNEVLNAVAGALRNMSKPGNASLTDPVTLLEFIFVDEGSSQVSYIGGVMERAIRVAQAVYRSLSRLSASGNLMATELLQMANNTIVHMIVGNGAQLPNSSAVAGNLTRALGQVLMQTGLWGNCSATNYDSLLKCLLWRSSQNANESWFTQATDRLLNIAEYVLFTGLQNSTRTVSDLSQITGIAAFLNNTVPHLNNLTSVAMKVEEIFQAVQQHLMTVVMSNIKPNSTFDPFEVIVSTLLNEGRNFTRFVSACQSSLAQLSSSGNFLAKDLLQLMKTDIFKSATEYVVNAMLMVSQNIEAALTVRDAVLSAILPRVMVMTDPMAIINYALARSTADRLYAAVNGALLNASRSGNLAALNILQSMNTPTFAMVWGYVVNVTGVARDGMAVYQALYDVFLKSTKSYNMTGDPMTILYFLMNEAAVNKLVLDVQNALATLAKSGNYVASNAVQIMQTTEYKLISSYVFNITSMARDFASGSEDTCFRPPVKDIALGRLFSDDYNLTVDAAERIGRSVFGIIRCELRVLNQVTGGAIALIDDTLQYIASMLANTTGIAELKDALLWKVPTNSYAAKAPVSVVSYFGGGWTDSYVETALQKCNDVTNYDVLINNRYYTLWRSYFAKNNTETVYLTFYYPAKSGDLVAVASYVVVSSPKGPAAAPATLINAARKPAATVQGNGFKITATTSQGIVTVTNSYANAAFKFYITKSKRIVVVVRATTAEISNSIGTLIYGCLSEAYGAKMLDKPRPACLSKCVAGAAKPPAGCTIQDCKNVLLYQNEGYAVIDQMQRTILP